ncbi:MAG: disulfide bond formation protein B [Hyphomicrobiaceae bacterium]
MSRVVSPQRDPAYRAGAAAFFLALAAILGALAAQHVWGIEPCALCFQQRYAYYAGIPALFIALILVAAEFPRAATLVFFVVALAFLANAGLAAYHSGVEWKFWPGPDTCSQAPGALKPIGSGGSVLGNLSSTRVIRCDEASWRFLGLSFAGWNVIASFMIFVAALQAAFAASTRFR